MDIKFLYWLFALVIGIILMSVVGYTLGIFIIIPLIGIAGWMIWTYMIKPFIRR